MSERKEIKNGDKVKIWWDDYSTTPIVNILNMPRGAGDFLQVEHKNGTIEAINTSNPNFRGLTKIIKESE